MILARIGLGLAWRRGRKQWWRVAAISIAALVLTFGALLSASLYGMNQNQHDRASQLTARPSTVALPTDVLLRPTLDRIDGRTVLVEWVAPVPESTGTTNLGPGMNSFPEPGCTWVSPALDRLLDSRVDLKDRYGCRQVLDWNDVVTGSELLAYVRPADDTAVGPAESAISFVNGRAEGAGPAMRYVAPTPVNIPDLLPSGDILIGMFVFLVGPALLLLWVALSALSDRRTRRFRVLRALGCPTSAVQRIAAVEVLSIVAPVSAATATIWVLASKHITAIPFVGLNTAPGDLMVEPLTATFIVGSILVIALAMSAIRELVPTRRKSRKAGVLKASILPALPVMTAAAMLTTSGFLGNSSLAVDLRYLGALLAIAGAPFLVPSLVTSLAAQMSESPRWLLWVSGRAMERRATHYSRPFMGLAGLCAMVILSLGYVTALSISEDPFDRTPGTSSASVTWVNSQPTAVADLQAALDQTGGDFTVVPVAPEGGAAHDHDHEEGEHLLVGASCPTITTYHLAHDCSELDVMISELSLATSEGVAEVELVDPASLTDTSTAWVLSSGSPEATDAAVREAAFDVIGAPSVKSQEGLSSMASSQAISWVTAGVIAGPTILVVAALVSAANHVVSSRRQWNILVNVGMERRRLVGLDLLHLVVPWAAAMALGLIIGALSSSAIDTVPWAAAAITTGAISLAYGLLTVAVSFLGLRQSQPETAIAR